MFFIISFLLAGAFVLLLGNSLKKHPVPFYIGTAVLTAIVTALDLAGVIYPAFVSEYVIPLLTGGSLAGALFVIVMWGGAFPNGSTPMKIIMPVRGQLSVIASILVAAHAVKYKTFIISLFTTPDSLKGATLAAAICSLLLLIILIPLFVTSFKRIRKKIKPKIWKNLQRVAYVFYALTLGHILLFTYKNAMLGRSGYRLNVVIYTLVFGSYAICRILKAVSVKRKITVSLGMKQMKAVTVFAIAVTVLTAVLFGGSENVKTGAAETKQAAKTDESIELLITDDIVSIGLTDTDTQSDTTRYNDGVFTGEAFGNSGMIGVRVTLKDDTIVSIEISEQDEDEPYFTDALAVIPAMIEKNSTEVDTVSGATYSSEGILEAVKNAMNAAEKR